MLIYHLLNGGLIDKQWLKLVVLIEGKYIITRAKLPGYSLAYFLVHDGRRFEVRVETLASLNARVTQLADLRRMKLVGM